MKFVLVILGVLLSGCVSTPLVEQAVSEEAINTVAMTCESPYRFEQDCSEWLGAAREITLAGRPIRVAGSADGRIVMVKDPNIFVNTLKDVFVLNSPSHSRANNASFGVLRDFLVASGVVIKRVRPLRSFGNTDGYVLELDRDGYSFLKALPSGH